MRNPNWDRDERDSRDDRSRENDRPASDWNRQRQGQGTPSGDYGNREREYGNRDLGSREYGNRDYANRGDGSGRGDSGRQDQGSWSNPSDYRTGDWGRYGSGSGSWNEGDSGRRDESRTSTSWGGRETTYPGRGDDSSRRGFNERQYMGQGASPSDWRASEPRRGQHAGVGPKGYQRSDDRIREEICDCLTADGAIDPSDVEVSVSGGEVTLTGTVAHRRHKREIEEMCEGCNGVKDVHNNLRVKSGDERRNSTKSESESSSPTSSSTSGNVKTQQQPVVRNMPETSPPSGRNR